MHAVQYGEFDKRRKEGIKCCQLDVGLPAVVGSGGEGTRNRILCTLDARS